MAENVPVIDTATKTFDLADLSKEVDIHPAAGQYFAAYVLLLLLLLKLYSPIWAEGLAANYNKP